MKNTVRRILSFVLCVCVVIGFPLSIQVSAEAELFEVVKVKELPDSQATADLPVGRTLLVYFNNALSDDAISITGLGKAVNIRIRAYGDGLEPKDMNGEIVAAYGGNPIAVSFGNNKDNNMPAMREAGYDTFLLAIRENNSGTTADQGYIKGFADINGILLTAPDGTVNKYDEVTTTIEHHSFMVTKVEELPDSQSNDELHAGRTLLVYFNNALSSNAISITGLEKAVNIRIQAYGDGLENKDMNGEIVANYGNNPIAVTFGNDTTNNMAAMREAGYNSFRLIIRENNSGTTADKGYIKDFSDINGVFLTAGDGSTDKWDEVNVPINQQYDAKIGDAYYAEFAEALACAQTGDTVTLLNSLSIDDMVFVVKANIVLDLHGCKLEVKNVMAFGHIIDSTEGTGKLVVDQMAHVILLRDNLALPLYDIDGYRFFSYYFRHVGTKSDELDPSWVKYGIKLHFDSIRAYELLADEMNDNVTLAMDIVIGHQEFTYKFNHIVFDNLYETMTNNNFEDRNKYAIVLTIRGWNKQEADGVIQAMPILTSACHTIYSGDQITYEGQYDSYTRARAWIQDQIKNDTLFSFRYNGASYADHIGKWEKTIVETDTGWKVTYKNGNVLAWSVIDFDPETASIEWTNYFKNEGNSSSPVIQDILAIDSCVDVANPVLTTANGSNKLATDFQPISVDLDAEGSYAMATTGGRSSQGAWPYFDISNGEYGIMGAIGWTGNWKAEFVHDNGLIDITAGMKTTRISLNAGEQMRTPMIMIQFFKGDQDDGHNALRRLMLKSYTPADASGNPIQYAPYFLGVTNEVGQGEAKLLEVVKDLDASDSKYECFWMDAGWYGDYENAREENTWGTQVGSWRFVSSIYPNGNVQELRQYLKDRDKGLLLWFEPERVRKDSDIYNQHEDWLLNIWNEKTTFLYDFSNDAACDYMIEHINTIIQENELTWYRQDLNVEPEEYWSYNELLNYNRKGMTEIKYITNLYRFLDEIIEQNPGIMIDNCAAGGRRLDLEMMKRSVPLWNSDYANTKPNEATGELGSTPDGIRSVNFNLSWWLPIHAGGWPWYNTGDSTADRVYNFRAVMNSGINLTPPIAKISTVKNLLEQYFDCREIMNGDYYILAGGKDGGIETEDACYEFYKEDAGKGYLLAFRPKQCVTSSNAYVLKGLDANATYELTWEDSGETQTMTGRELMTDGLTISYSQANQALLIYFTK